jgi:branched-chain amino acid transport system substrate-binding protein
MGSWGIGTPDFIREMGPVSEFLYGTSVGEVGTAPAEARAEEEAMVAAYQAKYNESPSYIAVLCYLGAKYMLDAIHKGGGPQGAYSAEKTRNALRSMDVISPIGRVAFDAKGDPKFFTALLFQVQKGKLVVIYPANRVNGQVVYPMVPWGAK